MVLVSDSFSWARLTTLDDGTRSWLSKINGRAIQDVAWNPSTCTSFVSSQVEIAERATAISVTDSIALESKADALKPPLCCAQYDNGGLPCACGWFRILRLSMPDTAPRNQLNEWRKEDWCVLHQASSSFYLSVWGKTRTRDESEP